MFVEALRDESISSAFTLFPISFPILFPLSFSFDFHPSEPDSLQNMLSSYFSVFVALSSVVATVQATGSLSSGPLPKLIVLDLDHTVWPYYFDKVGKSPLKKGGPTSITDRYA